MAIMYGVSQACLQPVDVTEREKKRLLAIHFLVVLKARSALSTPRVTTAGISDPHFANWWLVRDMDLKDIATSTRIRSLQPLGSISCQWRALTCKNGVRREISLPFLFVFNFFQCVHVICVVYVLVGVDVWVWTCVQCVCLYMETTGKHLSCIGLHMHPKIYLYFFFYVCMCHSACVEIRRVQRQLAEVGCLLFIAWTPGIKSRLSCLVASTFIH